MELLTGREVNASIYLDRCWNETGQSWYYNVSVNYTNQTGAVNQQYLNLTNISGSSNGILFTANQTEWNTTGWAAIVGEPVRDIINITYVNTNITGNISFNIVANITTSIANITVNKSTSSNILREHERCKLRC